METIFLTFKTYYMYQVILTGTKGMNKSVWRKIDKAPFDATFKPVDRPMHDWEVSLLQYKDETNPSFAWKQIESFIGDKLRRKYTIAFTHL